tara:strand:- start:40315 stop:43278 length:2964 start_codon:yes stop_codon:yes gene_type:complete
MPRRLGKNPEVYNIPAHNSFVDILAAGIMERFGSDPLSLSKVLVLLPNRRAVRSLREAFLRLSDGRPIILPSLQPIGDVDEDDLVMGAGALYDDLSLKPAVPPHIRQMLLMNIIHSWYMKRGEDIPENAARAVLAEALGHLLDQVQTEQINFADLKDIVPEEYAIHWQQTLDFLEILTENWPDILATTGYMDAATRRNELLYALRESWLDEPPEHPIIAAGSTGSVKATSSLLQVIARLPRGAVILPGLDTHLDEESWDMIEDTHPQATMKHLLEVIGADRIEVENWNGETAQADHIKTQLFREMMRPAQTTDRWHDLDWDQDQVLEGIDQIVTPGVREEAGVIALMMREQLNKPRKTAALVTPDRMLARQVAGELARWNIDIDDSAGTPLFNTAVGVYLRLTAEMVADQYTPISLMSALKHPLMAGGSDIADFRATVRTFEHKYLRGPRPTPGLDGIDQLFAHESSVDDRLFEWWQDLRGIIEPFDQVMQGNANFGELLIAHMEMAEKLAATNDENGATRLWKGDDGEVAAKLIEDLQLAAPYLREFKPDQYAALFEQFMSSGTVRSKYGQHPRLNIWGPLEARLQHADLMILSGLNEGIWPPEPTADPWMSRPMRRDFGLPGLEQKIGLSAHDFVQTASAENVVITRSEKVDGTPTVKSRWLNRLHAIVGEYHHEKISDIWLNWYEKLDKPEKPIVIDPPKPTPPVSSRPRELSVSRIQEWMRDPYTLYAKKILRLKKIDDLDQDPGAIDKGIIIHEILEDFMSHYKDDLPDDAEERLVSIGRNYFDKTIDRPTVRAFWWPRFKQIAKWFVEEERSRRETIKTIATETEGEIDLELAAGKFSLTAKADRIDKFEDGTLSIIDYKTGGAPTIRELKAGFAPQLTLEAAIAAKGGFALIEPTTVSELSYWKLSGGETAGDIKNFSASQKGKANADAMELANNAYDGLVKLVTTFDLPKTPYLNKPNPVSKGYGEYDHLARTKEWGDG